MTEIEDWVREQISAGYTQDQIKKSLIENGHNPAIVDDVLNSRNQPESKTSKRESNLSKPDSSDFNKKSYLQKVKSILFHPTKFFNEMPVNGGYWEPLKFVVITSVITYVISIINLTKIDTFEVLASIIIGSFVIALFAAPMIFLITGIVHLLIKLVGGGRNFEATFRVSSYIYVIGLCKSILGFVYSIIFFILYQKTSFKDILLENFSNLSTTDFVVIGFFIILNFIILIYGLYLFMLGLSKVHNISKIRAFIASLGPFILVLLLFLLLLVPAVLWQMGAFGADCAVNIENQQGALIWVTDVEVFSSGVVDATIKNIAGERITINSIEIQDGGVQRISNIANVTPIFEGKCYAGLTIPITYTTASSMSHTVKIHVSGTYQE